MQALVPLYAGFIMVLMRCGGLCAVAPLLGMHTAPVRIRVGVAVGLAMAVFFAAGTPAFAAHDDLGALVVAGFSETIIGLAAGMSARVSLDAAHSAGHAMGLSMGLGFGSVVDPLNGAESTALSELLSMVALGVAVAAGIHREAVAWLCRSVMESPPGVDVNLARIAADVVAESARAAALGVRLAFPVMAAVTMGHFSFGLISRAAPQINLQSVGFGVAILAGGGALYLCAPAVAELAAQAARASFAPR